MIKDHCVGNDIIDEAEGKPIVETAEVVRIKLNFEREERRLAHEEAQRAREAAEAEAQKAGATQSLMLDSVLNLTENSFTGANVLISGVEMGVLEVPLHEVNIKSSLIINGNIVIDMRPSLPVEGISLILRNDLVGEKVMVDPRVVEKPTDDKKQRGWQKSSQICSLPLW